MLRDVLDADEQCTQADCSTASGWLDRAEAITAVLDDLGGFADGKSGLATTIESYRNAHMQLRSCIQLSDEKPGSDPDVDCQGPISLVERGVEDLRGMTR